MKSVLPFDVAWETFKTSITEDIISLTTKMDQEYYKVTIYSGKVMNNIEFIRHQNSSVLKFGVRF